jgi:type I restriction enzyme S subunit
VRTVPLWSVADIRPSNVDKKSDPSEAAVRLVNYTDVYYNQRISADLDLMGATASADHIERFRVLPGDLIITKDSETSDDIGIPALVETASHDMVCAYHLSLLRPDTNRVDPRFLFWCLDSSATKGYWRTASFGVTRVSIPLGTVARLPVPDLDLGTQKGIAAYLDRETGEIDAMLAKLEALIVELQDRVRIVQTRAVFGLGDYAARRGSESDSVLSGIPEHWDFTKFGYDFTESTERNGDDPLGPLLSISEYRGVELNTRSEGQRASLDVSKYRVVRPGQLAANMMWLNHGGLGVSSLTGYISPDYKAFWISDRFEPRYVHHLFRSSRYIDYFAAIATGVRPNAQRVTKTVLDATPVPVPPLDEQIRIADELDEATADVNAMLTKVAHLKSLLLERRAALITDVVTGKKEIV